MVGLPPDCLRPWDPVITHRCPSEPASPLPTPSLVPLEKKVESQAEKDREREDSEALSPPPPPKWSGELEVSVSPK